MLLQSVIQFSQTVFLKGQTCYCRVLPIILTQFVCS